MSRTVQVSTLINRTTVNPADLAADYKSRGIGRAEAWSRFVTDMRLLPGIDAKKFYSIYDQATAQRLSQYTATPFEPTHEDTLRDCLVQVTKTDFGHSFLWQDGGTGSDTGELSSRYKELDGE